MPESRDVRKKVAATVKLMPAMKAVYVTRVLALAQANAVACSGCLRHDERGHHGVLPNVNNAAAFVVEVCPDLTTQQAHLVVDAMIRMKLWMYDRRGNGKFRHMVILDSVQVTAEMVRNRYFN